ncbi:PAAR domain-containing protein [Streptomyces sp. NPDC006487]|uniref:PAAR domain-containing protein n=1 Tax=Streptomyces sp. NPDC006487 TaxID=3364748 RepID=UPI003685D2DB
MPRLPAARLGDKVTGTDIHMVIPPPPSPPTPQPMPFPYQATLTGGCCPTVRIGGKPAATLSTTATISPPHVPPGPMAFAPQVPPPTNTGTVMKGSASVRIGGKPAARVGDTVQTCSFPAPAPNGRIMPPVPQHGVSIG